MEIIQTVYLVDDDPSIRKTLPRALRLRGFTVEAFESAKAFLDVFSTDLRGCLLLDLSMPDMDGLELQSALEEMGSTLPIIFITGHGGIPESVKALKRGAVDFLEKPFLQETLLQRIEEAIAQDTQNFAFETKRLDVIKRFEKLTEREIEVLQLMVSGPANLSNKVIANQLGISFRTVGHHRARIMEKSAARSIAELARMADLAGITTA